MDRSDSLQTITRRIHGGPAQLLPCRRGLFIGLIWLLSACSGPAPGSSVPHLATHPDDNVIMSWLEPDGDSTALRYSVLNDGAWSRSKMIASGDDWFVNWADFPSVVAVDDSLWAAHWLVKAADGTYEYDIAISISTDAGKTWQKPLAPHTDGTLSEHGFVSLYPLQDGIGALWLDGRDMQRGMTLRSAKVTRGNEIAGGQLVDDLVCDCCQTDVAIGPLGPIAVYRNRSSDEIRDIYVTRMIDGRWEPGRPVAKDGWKIAACPVNGPAIAANGDKVAVTWFTAAGGASKVRLAFSGDGAGVFWPAIDIDVDRPIGRVGLLLLEDGTALVSWLRNGDDGSGDIMVRAATAAGTLGDATRIASTSAGRLSGFPQIVEYGDQIVFAWTDTDGDRTSIETTMISTESLIDLQGEAAHK